MSEQELIKEFKKTIFYPEESSHDHFSIFKTGYEIAESRLQSQLKKAEAVIKFYADTKSWQTPENQGFKRYSGICDGLADMVDDDDDGEFAGKRARAYFADLERGGVK